MKVELTGSEDSQLKYKVFINGHWFDYFTGVAYAHHTTSSVEEFSKKHDLSSDDFAFDCANLVMGHEYFAKTKINHRSKFVSIVKRKDVEYALYRDSQLGNMSFFDFCDELGLNNDSMKDFEVLS